MFLKIYSIENIFELDRKFPAGYDISCELGSQVREEYGTLWEKVHYTIRERARTEISIEKFQGQDLKKKKGLGRQLREIFFGSVGLVEPQNFF